MATVTSTGGVRLPSGSNMVSVINAIVDELTDDGVDVPNVLVLTRHTGDEDPEGDDAVPLGYRGEHRGLLCWGRDRSGVLRDSRWRNAHAGRVGGDKGHDYDDEDVDLMVSLASTGAIDSDGMQQDLFNDQVAIGDEGDMEDDRNRRE